jgi:hypothetical protein
MKACSCALNFTAGPRCLNCPARDSEDAEFQSIRRADDRYEPCDDAYARMEAEPYRFNVDGRVY